MELVSYVQCKHKLYLFSFSILALMDDLVTSMQVSIGSFYPNLLLAGILWPVKGMPKWLATNCMANFSPHCKLNDTIDGVYHKLPSLKSYENLV